MSYELCKIVKLMFLQAFDAGELSVQKGEVLSVLGAARVRGWIVVCNARGEQGIIPTAITQEVAF